MRLLATPKQTIGATELKRSSTAAPSLMQTFRYSDSVTVPDWAPEKIIEHGAETERHRPHRASHG